MDRRCPYCGKTFMTDRANAIYCKTSCRVLASGRRREERRVREALEHDARRREQLHQMVDQIFEEGIGT